MEQLIQFELNGKKVEKLLDTDLTLLWVLRDQFGLTGTKFGCGAGVCGACTVLVDNEAIRSCSLPVSEVAGKKVLTIEGLSQNDKLHPLQQAFIDHDALQCGFCTPGMIMSAYALLLKNPVPSRKDIIAGMENNLCRCGTHGRIMDAIESASKVTNGGK